MKKFLKIIPLVVFINFAKAQHFTHEVGFFVGNVTMQTDYGERYNFLSEIGNNKVTFTFSHLLTFYNKQITWNDRDDIWNYIALKTEVNVIPGTELEHFGQYVEGGTDLAADLKAMKGTVSMVSVGTGIEYYFKSLHEFSHPYSDIIWNPYVSLGVRYSFYENDIESSQGNWREDISVLPQKYRIPGNLAVGSGGAWSAIFGGGVRFKLSEKIDLGAQANLQYFFSDAIDGLVAKVPENKNNDWMVNLQVGLVYHLNYSEPLSFFGL